MSKHPPSSTEIPFGVPSFCNKKQRFFCLYEDTLFEIQEVTKEAAVAACANHLQLPTTTGIEAWAEKDAPGQLHMYDPPVKL